MDNFDETVDTIEAGVGFAHFDMCHIAWLAAFVCVALISSLLYRRLNVHDRKIMQWVFTAFILANELWKWTWLFITEEASAGYLPFHLCSINIFLVTFHTIKPTKTVGNFLYMACIPGAIAALLFPTWTKLPFFNFMHLHSFTVHIALAVYPIMLMAGGDIRPRLKDLPKSIGLLAVMGTAVYCINLWLDTNFMFLMKAVKGTPLVLFEKLFGSNLLGLLVLVGIVIFVMYLPVCVKAGMEKRKKPVKG